MLYKVYSLSIHIVDTIKRISDFIREKNLLNRGDRILLSLSAGKDSMMLLHVMSILRSEYNLEPAIFHLNHLMRGQESDLDEEHVRRCASDLDMPFFSERFCFNENKSGNRCFEDHAREVRYSLLETIARENRYTRIATAHSNDDQVETVLMRILTGSGIYGLRGIDSARNNIIRPLLCLSSAEIYDYLRDHNILWREDSTNTDTGHVRNYIRHELLPVIRKRFPVDRSLPDLADHAREMVNLVDGFIDRDSSISLNDGSEYIIGYETVQYNFPLLKHLISRYMREQMHSPLTARVFQEMRKNLESEHFNVTLYRSTSLTIERMIYKGSRVIRIGSPELAGRDQKHEWEYKLDISEISRSVNIPELTLNVMISQVDEEFFSAKRALPGWIFFTLPDNIDTLVLRNRRDGDRIELESGSKKIKDYMIEKKLDRHVRGDIPILVIDGKVAAVMPGLLGFSGNRISRVFQVQAGSEKIFALHSPDAVY